MRSNASCSPHPDDPPAEPKKKPLYTLKSREGEKAWDAKLGAVAEIKRQTGSWPSRDDPEHGHFMRFTVGHYVQRRWLNSDQYLKLSNRKFPRSMAEINPPQPLGDTPLGRTVTAYKQGRPGDVTKADINEVRGMYMRSELGEVTVNRLRVLGFPF